MLKSYKNKTSLFLEKPGFRSIHKLKCLEAIPCIYEYLIYDNGATQGESTECLADGARKNEFLYKKTISLNLDFVPYIKEVRIQKNEQK